MVAPAATSSRAPAIVRTSSTEAPATTPSLATMGWILFTGAPVTTPFPAVKVPIPLSGDLARISSRVGALLILSNSSGCANSRPGQHDTVTDFQNNDKIDLSAIDANTSTSTQDAFVFVAASTQDVQANSVTWYYDQATDRTIVQSDIDGVTITAELEIHLQGQITLTATDFILHA